MRACTKCHENKVDNDFYHRPDGRYRMPCKACEKAQVVAWRAENKEQRNKSIREYYRKNPEVHASALIQMRERNLAKWKITIEGYNDLLLKQGGGCGICGSPDPGGGRTNFCVDHDHSCCDGQFSCGKCIRGLLCLQCNRALGLLKDEPMALLAAFYYLEDHRAH